MKNNKVTYFPVGNGDMSLVQLADGHVILIDCCLQREVSDTCPTTVDGLLEQLPKDDEGRPYVDVFILTHPDEDHCRGAKRYLHLADPDSYKNEEDADGRRKIFVREVWSSPLIFRRKSSQHELCADAKAINTEAKRRVQVYRDKAGNQADGNRILIIGADYGGKDNSDRLSGLEKIRHDVGDTIEVKDADGNAILQATVLAPLPPGDDEEALSKNNSSIVMQFETYPLPGGKDYNLLLFGGDAEVEIWYRLSNKHDDALLTYDILLAPHHCSWGALSEEAAEHNAKADFQARHALSRRRNKAYVVASSTPVKDNKNNPPALRAKKEYIEILDDGADRFICTGEHPSEMEPGPLVFELTASGPKAPSKKTAAISAPVLGLSVSKEARGHG